MRKTDVISLIDFHRELVDTAEYHTKRTRRIREKPRQREVVIQPHESSELKNLIKEQHELCLKNCQHELFDNSPNCKHQTKIMKYSRELFPCENTYPSEKIAFKRYDLINWTNSETVCQGFDLPPLGGFNAKTQFIECLACRHFFCDYCRAVDSDFNYCNKHFMYKNMLTYKK